MGAYIAVSSAYIMVLAVLIIDVSPSTYRMKRSGPRMEPWSTPVSMGIRSEYILLMYVHWRLLVKYERNQFKKVGSIFRKESLVSRVMWSRVSKAFRKSIKVLIVSLLLFMLVPASSIKVVMAFVVESPGRKPNCLFERRL